MSVDFGLVLKMTKLREGHHLGAHGAVTSLQEIGKHISASQAKTAELCWRKWWLLKAAHIKERDKQHFRTGKALHAVAERYIGRIATNWAELFPPGWDKGLDEEGKAFVSKAAELAVTMGMWQTSQYALVEFPIALLVGQEFLDARGMPLVARAETFEDESGTRRVAKLVCLYDGTALPPGFDRLPPFVGFVDIMYLGTNPPAVIDHKTAKRRRYTLSAKELVEDLQMCGYACAALSLRPDANQVALRHNVFLKDPEAPHPAFMTNATITVEQARAKWQEVIRIAEGMEQARAKAPKIEDPNNPFIRANNYMRVRGACDEGKDRIKEACDAYGGCPFKPACHGWQTMESLVRKMDAPDVMALVQKPAPAITYGLAPARSPGHPAPTQSSTLTSPPPKETPMPFNPAAAAAAQLTPASFPVGTNALILDPDNKALQYRVRIYQHMVNEQDGSADVRIGLWPHPEIEPAWHAIPSDYVALVSLSQLYHLPNVGARTVGYQETLVNTGRGEASTWYDVQGRPHAPPTALAPASSPLVASAPAAPAAPSPAAGVEGAKVAQRTPPDGAFGLAGHTPAPAPTMLTSPGQGVVGSASPGTPLPGAPTAGHAAVAQHQRAAASEAAALAAVPAPTFEPQVGDVVEVIASAHSYFGPLAGKQGVITDVSVGETQPVVAVQMADKTTLPDILVGRFKLVSRPSAVQPPAQQTLPGMPAAEAPPLPDSLEAALSLKGKQVCVRLAGVAAPYNAILEDVDQNGITILNGTIKAPWPAVQQLTLMKATDIPGHKPTREEKAAAKEKAEAAALYAARATALDQALAAVTTATGEGGKVTKKAMEALLPLLQTAKAYQNELVAGLNGGTLPPSATTGDPMAAAKIDVVRAALKQAIGSLGQVQAAIG